MRISDWSSDVCSSDLMIFQPAARPDMLARLRHAMTIDRDRPILGARQPIDIALLPGQPRKLQVRQLARREPQLVLHQHASRPLTIGAAIRRSEEHTSELQSLMRISYAVFCLKKNIQVNYTYHNNKTSITTTITNYNIKLHHTSEKS